MKGGIGDEAAVAEMVENYRALCRVWDRARAAAKERAA